MKLGARALGAWALLAAGCGAGPDGSAPPGHVLLLAVDGFEWDVALPLLRAGRMPELAELARRGTFGTLKPMKPSKSPRLWTTIATGKPPAEHGILDFTWKDAEGRELLTTSAQRKVKAFWNILGDHGVESDTIGWWVTYPVEPVAGTMVAQTNTAEGALRKGALLPGTPGQVWPPELEPEVFAALEVAERGLDAWMHELFGAAALEARNAELRRRWEECRWSLRADRTYLEILRARLGRGPPARVTSIYVGGTDVLAHRFWTAYEPQAFEPRPDEREVELVGEVIPRYYEFVDGLLGELRGRFPADTAVLVVADHGMRRGMHTGEEAGVFLAAGPGIRSSGIDLRALQRSAIPELGRLTDVCPTLLALALVPYGADMQGRPLTTVLDPRFLARHPPRSVATHDDPAWLARPGAEVRVEDPERLEQLRALGYLGGAGGE
jgi:predicted AlkP superfamily pyrophosphatase or phosphodiesterase